MDDGSGAQRGPDERIHPPSPDRVGDRRQFRGIERETYACTPRCERKPVIGDEAVYYDTLMKQGQSRNEAAVGELLDHTLSLLDYETRRVPAEDNRFDVYAVPRGSPAPVVVFSTHMDVVPPWMPSSEDEQNIYGRGACDAKGIIAAQIGAAERLRTENVPIGLLFVVGEERSSIGASSTPVREVDNRQIGTGTVGPVVKKVQEMYFRVVRGQEPRYAEWLTYV